MSTVCCAVMYFYFVGKLHSNNLRARTLKLIFNDSLNQDTWYGGHPKVNTKKTFRKVNFFLLEFVAEKKHERF